MNRACNSTFFGPTPWGPGEGSKGQISLSFNYKVNFESVGFAIMHHRLQDLVLFLETIMHVFSDNLFLFYFRHHHGLLR